MSALTNAIYQNTPGNSQGNPLDVPSSWSWYNGTNTVDGNKPPSNFTSVTGWGQVYDEVGKTVDTNASANVQVQDFQTYVLLTNGSWVEVQQQNASTNPVQGYLYSADYSGNVSSALATTNNSDGSVSIKIPSANTTDNFWTANRGTYAAGTVEGVFVEANVKTNDASANLIANLGADWWLSATAPYGSGQNNPGSGQSDWVQLTTSYQTLYFTSLSAAQLQADPPPGLATTTAAAPTVAITTAAATVSTASKMIVGTVDVADAGSTVQIWDGATQIGSATVAANGAWSDQVTLASQGANVVTATDTNATGEGHSNSVTFDLVPAVAAPTVAITSSSRWTALANQTITGTVDIADAGSTVKILDGATQIGSATVAASGAWSANVTLAQGANALTATDTNAGGTGVSNAVSMHLTNSPPSLTISSAGGTTDLARQTISGTANLASAYVGSTVHILDGTTQIGTATIAAGGGWSAAVTLANQGSNVVTATDANGNGTGVSNSVTYNLTAAAAALAPASVSTSSLVSDSVAQSAVATVAAPVSSTTTASVALLNQYAASGFATDASSTPSLASIAAQSASQSSFLAAPRH